MAMTSGTKVRVACGLLYLVFTDVVVYGVFAARAWTLSHYGTPQAQADWNQWRTTAKRHASGGPVQRRVPSSAEPPALVLMRDRFAVVLTAAIVFGSLVFAAIVLPSRKLIANWQTRDRVR